MQEDNKGRKSRNRIAVYLMVLFLVAFLLMLFSYLVSERNNAIAMENLTNSHSQATASAFENIDLLQKENETLKDEAAANEKERQELLDKVESLENQVDDLTEENEALKDAAQENEKAVELLLSLEHAAAANDSAAAKSVISQAEKSGTSFTQALTESQLARWNELSKKF